MLNLPRSAGFFFVVAAALTALGCGGNSHPPIGAVCTVNSECNNPLSCTFGKCHETCREARDCPAGQRCVMGPVGAVCQIDAACTYRSDCMVPLICALDRQCRNQCQADIDCPTKTQKCVRPDMVCAEPEEINPAGKLKQAQSTPVPDSPGAADAGAGAGADGAPAPDAPTDTATLDTSVAADAPVSADATVDRTALDTSGAPMPATWGTSAAPFRGMLDKHLIFNCPPSGTSGGVWGTDTYTDDSSICNAAVHSGLITYAGGDVTIEIRPGQASYPGSMRNGVTSSSYGNWTGSFVFFPLKFPNCGNLAKEGDETDTDCGGSCPRCSAGKLCAKNEDCTAMVCSTRCVFSATWASSAAIYRGMTGLQFPYACPPNGTPGSVWGTDVYTDDSSVCTAAVHAGKITLAAGGTVTFRIVEGQPSYAASVRNGVTTNAYGAFSGSFSFP